MGAKLRHKSLEVLDFNTLTVLVTEVYKQQQLNGHDCGVGPYRGGNRVDIVVFKA